MARARAHQNDVGIERHAEARAKSDAVDCGDQRLVQRRQRASQFGIARHARAALLDRPRGAIGHALDVAARAEVAARTRQHHGADVVGGTQPTQGCDERVGGRDIDRVLCRWPVQREDGHAVRALEEDAVARHVRG
jgi:hypothetical protein